MGFSIEDVIETLKIVKECEDAALHIDTGDLKLSIFKGDVGESPSLTDLSGACQVAQVESEAAAPVAVPKIDQEQKPALAPPAAAATKEVSDASEEGLLPIKATITSIFYRRPSPEEPPFVEVGDIVQEDTVVCLLEVMKCFRQVTADVRGRVEKICVNDSDLVEAGTVMFLIRPE